MGNESDKTKRLAPLIVALKIDLQTTRDREDSLKIYLEAMENLKKERERHTTKGDLVAENKALEGRLSAIRDFVNNTLEKAKNSTEVFYAEMERKYPQEPCVSVCVLKELGVLLQLDQKTEKAKK